MCRQTLPSFHCYLPVQTHARGGETAAGACLELGGDTDDHMWSCVLQEKEQFAENSLGGVSSHLAAATRPISR